MKVTDVRIKPVEERGKLKAYVTVTFDDCFVLHNVKVVEGKTEKDLFIAMPSRKLPSGEYKDTAHPITAEFRKEMQDKILDAYANMPQGEAS